MNDEVTGNGLYNFSDGTKYVGSFRSGKFHGVGFVQYENGAEYSGDFKDDKKDGVGGF